MLLILMSFAVGFSIAAAYVLSRELLGDERAAFKVSLLYALNPGLLNAQLFDFQEQCFLPLLGFLTYLFYVRRDYWKFFAFLLLSLAVNEFVSLLMTAFFLGLAVSEFGLKDAIQRLRSDRACKWVAIAIATSASWFLLAHVVIGTFSSTGIAEFFKVPVREDGTIKVLKMHPAEIVLTLLSQPSLLIEAYAFDIERKVVGLLLFIAPLLGIPLLEPCFSLPMLLFVVGAWASIGEHRYTFIFHYPFYFLHIMFIAFLRVMARKSASKKLITAALAITIVLYAANWYHSAFFGDSIPFYDERARALEKAAQIIPRDASVLTDSNVFPRFATRSKAYCLYDEAEFSEMVRVLRGFDVDYIVVDRGRGDVLGHGWAGRVVPYALDMMRSGHYGLYAWGGGIRVLKRNYRGEPILIEPVERYASASLLTSNRGDVCLDLTSRSFFIIAHRAGSGLGNIWYGPYITLMPGKYRATYRVKVVGEVGEEEVVLYVDVVSDSGKTVYAAKALSGKDLPASGEWFDVVLEFNVDQGKPDFEFRGFAKSDISIYLDYVLIEKVC